MATKGHVTIFIIIISSNESFIYKQHSVKVSQQNVEGFYTYSVYPQYSEVLETCLALRYWFFEVLKKLGSESVNMQPILSSAISDMFQR